MVQQGTRSTPLDTSSGLQEPSGFWTRHGVHFFQFIAVNVIVGAFGFLFPLLIAAARTDALVFEELVKQLAAAGPYTFAVSFLASTSSFIVSENLVSKSASHRGFKVFFGTLSLLLLIVCTVFSVALSSQSTPLAAPTSTSELSSTTNAKLTPHSPATDVARASLKKREVNSFSDLKREEVWQLAIVAMAVIVGICLFGLSRKEVEVESLNGRVKAIDAPNNELRQELRDKVKRRKQSTSASKENGASAQLDLSTE